MSFRLFEKLVGLLQESLVVQQDMAALWGGAILPELCVYVTLWYLAGGSYTNTPIFYLVGISQPSFCHVLWKTIKAINNCPKLRITWPHTKERQLECATGFTSISTNCALWDCVTVLDGYHLQTITPSKKKYIMCSHTFPDTIKHMEQMSRLRATTTVVFYLLVLWVQA